MNTETKPLSHAACACQEIIDVIERVENRCMAVDGPVTPTTEELSEDELRTIYQSAKRGLSATSTLPGKTSPGPIEMIEPATERDAAAVLAARNLPRALLLKQLDFNEYELCAPGVDGGYGGWLAVITDSTVKTEDEARDFKALCQLLAAAPQLATAGIAAAGALQAASEIMVRLNYSTTAVEMSTLLAPLIDAIGQATRTPL